MSQREKYFLKFYPISYVTCYIYIAVFVPNISALPKYEPGDLPIIGLLGGKVNCLPEQVE
jgi:hypothetical protein